MISLRNLFLSTGVLLALGAVSLTLMSCLVLQLPLDASLLTAIFLITFSIYVINRGMDLDEDTINKLERVKFIKNYKNLVLLIGVIAYSIALILTADKGLKIVASLCLPVIIGFVYTIRWVPNGLVKVVGFARLKDILLVKNISVAGIWAYSTVLVPVLYFSVPLSQQALILFCFIFLRCFINTLIFDIRDVLGDKSVGTTTLPAVLGCQRVKAVLQALNFFSAILILFAIVASIMPRYTVFSALVALSGFVIIRSANPHGKSMELLCDLFEDANETFGLFGYTLLGYLLIGL